MAIQNRILTELKALSEQFEMYLAYGETPAKARSEIAVASFDIRAQNYIPLVLDELTMKAYLELVEALATMEFLKVSQQVNDLDKSAGVPDEAWQSLSTSEPVLKAGFL